MPQYSPIQWHIPEVNTPTIGPGIAQAGQAIGAGIARMRQESRDDAMRKEDRTNQLADRAALWQHEDQRAKLGQQLEEARYTRRREDEQTDRKKQKEEEKRMHQDALLSHALGTSTALANVPGLMSDADQELVGKWIESGKAEEASGFLKGKQEQLGDLLLRQRQQQARDEERAWQESRQDTGFIAQPVVDPTGRPTNTYVAVGNKSGTPKSGAMPYAATQEDLTAQLLAAQKAGLVPGSTRVGGTTYTRPRMGEMAPGSGVLAPGNAVDKYFK